MARAKIKRRRKIAGRKSPRAVRGRAAPVLNDEQTIALRVRASKGDTLSADETQRLDEWQKAVGPQEAQRQAKTLAERMDKGEPPDVVVRTQKELAEICGVHVNTVTNWKRQGIHLIGSSPWSLKSFFLLLRKHAKLSETKPTTNAVQNLRAWCFGNGDATDPDDPAHQPPQGWQEESARQNALKARESRLVARIELETLQRQRIPIEEYRARWRKKAQLVLAQLDQFMEVTRLVPDLTETQRQALNAALRGKITLVRSRIAPKEIQANSDASDR